MSGHLNPFTPDFMKWILSISDFGQIGIPYKMNNRMANSATPDETACFKPSHLDLHCAKVYALFCRDVRLNSLPYTFSYMALLDEMNILF